MNRKARELLFRYSIDKVTAYEDQWKMFKVGMILVATAIAAVVVAVVLT